MVALRLIRPECGTFVTLRLSVELIPDWVSFANTVSSRKLHLRRKFTDDRWSDGGNPAMTNGSVNLNCLLNSSGNPIITVNNLILDADTSGWDILRMYGQSPEIFLLPKTAAGWP
jgi:hypothetical protein